MSVAADRNRRLLASTIVERKIRETMGLRNITQVQLAEMTGLSIGTVSRIVNGKASPSSESFLKIVKALNLDSYGAL